MGIFDWLFGGKKTTPPLKKETIVKKTAETTKKPVVNIILWLDNIGITLVSINLVDFSISTKALV